MMKIFRLIEGITITFLGFAFLGLLIWQGWQAYQVEGSFSLLAKNVNDTSILSFLVAVLVTAFGLDRIVHSRRLAEHLDSFAKRLASLEASSQEFRKELLGVLNRSLGGRLLVGKTEIYTSRDRLWHKMEHRMRVIVSVGGGGPKAPLEVVQATAQRLKERKDAGHEVSFTMILVIDPQLIPLEKFIQRIEERSKIYAEHSVKNCVHVHVIESVSSLPYFDVLIADSKHVNIGFPFGEDDHKLASALEFENQPKLAEDLISWYDKILHSQAKSFDDWVKEKRNILSPNKAR